MSVADGALECLKAERDENNCRKPFSKSEMGEMAARLLELEKPAAEGRKKATQIGNGQKNAENTGAGTVPAPGD